MNDKQPWNKSGLALRFPGVWGSLISRNQHMKLVKLSAPCTGHLYPQEAFPVLIAVRSWVDSRDIVRPEGLCLCKILMTPLGIEPATFRLVAQCLSQLPQLGMIIIKVIITAIIITSIVCTYFKEFYPDFCDKKCTRIFFCINSI
jgi:hypothetical protein